MVLNELALRCQLIFDRSITGIPFLDAQVFDRIKKYSYFQIVHLEKKTFKIAPFLHPLIDWGFICLNLVFSIVDILVE